MADFDSAWKETLDTLFEPFMASFFPEAHREIDWTQPHDPLEQELLKITPASEQGRRMSDKLIKVRRTSGREEWALVHIEFQSQPEAEFARRMYVYNYRFFDPAAGESVATPLDPRRAGRGTAARLSLGQAASRSGAGSTARRSRIAHDVCSLPVRARKRWVSCSAPY